MLYHLKTQTALGKEVAEHVNAGHLVPDGLTNKIVQDRIVQPDCTSGFVLDGYPRNLGQQKFLEQITKIDQAIVIEISDSEAIKRLGGRLACKCGLSYHTQFNPPSKAGICNKCGDELFKRDDDQPDAIKRRLGIYHQETEPLFKEYEQQGILSKVDGAKTIEEVYKQIDKILK